MGSFAASGAGGLARAQPGVDGRAVDEDANIRAEAGLQRADELRHLGVRHLGQLLEHALVCIHGEHRMGATLSTSTIHRRHDIALRDGCKAGARREVEGYLRTRALSHCPMCRFDGCVCIGFVAYRAATAMRTAFDRSGRASPRAEAPLRKGGPRAFLVP
jgi:hypothetical protein